MQKIRSGRAKTTPASTPVDRRVRKTREALRDALLALLPERGWDGIDVAALCARADVGRSTFYLHYTDKTDLLRGAFGDLQAHLMSSIGQPARDTPFPFLPALLLHVEAQREVFKALLGRRSGQVVRDHFLELLLRLFKAHSSQARPGDEARVQMLAGSLFQLLAWWLGTRRPLRPEAVEALFLDFAVQA